MPLAEPKSPLSEHPITHSHGFERFTSGASNPDMQPQERGASAFYDKLTSRVVTKDRFIHKRGVQEISHLATKDLGRIL